MTKEEILEGRKHIFGNALLAALSDTIMNMMDEWAGYLISNTSHVTTTLEVPKHILDEYAKQQAITFGEYLKNKSIGNLMRYDIQQHYNQFIEQQNKTNGSVSDR